MTNTEDNKQVEITHLEPVEEDLQHNLLNPKKKLDYRDNNKLAYVFKSQKINMNHRHI